MRVMTWNLWWRFGAWEQRQRAIVETIRRADPDVGFHADATVLIVGAVALILAAKARAVLWPPHSRLSTRGVIHSQSQALTVARHDGAYRAVMLE